MPLIKKYPNNVFLYELDPVEKTIHKKIYQLITEEFFQSVFGYVGGRNICLDNIDDPLMKNFVDQLYEIFYSISKDILGTVTLLENNKRTGWANLSDANYYLSSIHNHKNTATINGVYYFNILENFGGELDFYDEHQQITQTIMPKQNQFIVFPGYLNHKNRYYNSKEFRISINLEILCKEKF